MIKLQEFYEKLASFLTVEFYFLTKFDKNALLRRDKTSRNGRKLIKLIKCVRLGRGGGLLPWGARSALG